MHVASILLSNPHSDVGQYFLDTFLEFLFINCLNNILYKKSNNILTSTINWTHSMDSIVAIVLHEPFDISLQVWLSFFFLTEKRGSSCHISKHGHHSHQKLHPSNVIWWAPRVLRKEKSTCYLLISAIRLQPLHMVSPEELMMWKENTDSR